MPDTLRYVVEDPTTGDARRCLDSYFDVLSERFDVAFDRTQTNEVDVASMSPPKGWLILGRLDGRAVACGALKRVDATTADIKHVWVDAKARGLGVGTGLMDAIEAQAGASGITTVRLDTNRNLIEAIAMYRSRGYEEIDAYNDEVYAHHWFRKRLD